jgi:hypothetical protein
MSSLEGFRSERTEDALVRMASGEATYLRLQLSEPPDPISSLTSIQTRAPFPAHTFFQPYPSPSSLSPPPSPLSPFASSNSSLDT